MKYDKEKLLQAIGVIRLFVFENKSEVDEYLNNASTLDGKLNELEYYIDVERQWKEIGE